MVLGRVGYGGPGRGERALAAEAYARALQSDAGYRVRRVGLRRCELPLRGRRALAAVGIGVGVDGVLRIRVKAGDGVLRAGNGTHALGAVARSRACASALRGYAVVPVAAVVGDSYRSRRPGNSGNGQRRRCRFGRRRRFGRGSSRRFRFGRGRRRRLRFRCRCSRRLRFRRCSRGVQAQAWE